MNNRTFRSLDNQNLSVFYHWLIHLIFNFLLIILVLTYALFLTTPLLFSDICIIAVFFFMWGIIEYCIHRYILHGNLPLLKKLGREHSYNHHHYFTDVEMHATQNIDLSRIFLFSHHLIGLIFLNLALACLMFLFFAEQVAILFFIGGIFYILTYEFFHAASHLAFFNRFSWLNAIIKNHRLHHTPSNMNSSYFAVVFPFLDRWFGSIYEKN